MDATGLEVQHIDMKYRKEFGGYKKSVVIQLLCKDKKDYIKNLVGKMSACFVPRFPVNFKNI